MIDIVERLRFDAARCEADYSKGIATNIDEAMAEIVRLRKGYEDIKRATIEGRICDDVAWFDTITTLHDFCDMMIQPSRDGPGD